MVATNEYLLIAREAIGIARLPSSVRASDGGSSVVMVSRHRIPGTIDIQATIDFEKWPVVLINKYGSPTYSVNVAAPNGLAMLGRAIGFSLGV